MKIGFLGGTFDPIHVGHIQVALAAAEAVGLDKVYLLPTAQNYQKATAQATGAQRLAWVQAAIAPYEKLGALATDLRAGHIYTTDTLELLRKQFPADEFHWIVGGDQLANLWTWKNIENVVTQAAFIAVARAGYPTQAPTLPGLRLHTITQTLGDISSRQIRQLAAEGRDLQGLVPAEILTEVTRTYQTQTANQ